MPDRTWEQYLAVDAALGDRRGVKVRFLQGYLETVTQSAVLPGLPLGDVEECARIESASQAIREFRRRIAT